EPPRSAGWWPRALRSAAIDDTRARRRRSDHEARVEPQAEAPSAHEVVSEAESQRVVSDAVLALEEPYRTVILLRYFKGLGPRRIAAELGRPLGTVRAQLERGRALLRDRLRGEFGDDEGRSGLALALLPLATGDATRLVSAAGTLPVLSLSFLAVLPLAMKLVAALPLALLALFALSSLASEDRVEPAEVAVAAAPDRDELVDVVPRIQAPSSSTVRTTLADRSSDAIRESEVPVAGAARSLEGIALTVDRLPAASVLIELVAEGEVRETLWTAADGRFALQEGDEVRAAEPSYLVIGQRDVEGVREVVVAFAVRFAGRVVDEGGLPLDRVMLIDHDIKKAAGLDSGEGPVWRSSVGLVTNLGPGGAFDLERTPAFLGRTVCFSHPVFGAFEHPLPESDETDAVVVFRGVPSGYELEVRVLDPSGAPAHEAIVAVGDRVVVVDDRGEARFRIDPSFASEGNAAEAIVARVGYEPVHAPIPSVARVRERAADRSIVVTPSVRRRTVRGVVVHADGSPADDAMVGVWGATVLGSSLTAETLEFPEGRLSLSPMRTGEDGRFVLRSVARGPVTIRAAATSPLRVAEVVADADEIRIVLPDGASERSFEGTVVGLDGAPIEGARVDVLTRVTALDTEARRETVGATVGDRDTTGADGRFLLERIATDPIELRVTVGWARFHRVLAPGQTVVRIDAPCDIDVALDPGSAGGDLVVVDGTGAALRFVRARGNVFFQGLERHLVAQGGGTVQLRVPQSARTIQLIDGDGAILRRADVAPSRLQRARVEL
ncbi:MAG: sigma-70 family RNA polymerase sigma factor, partial [Planctomycetota bacterium]